MNSDTDSSLSDAPPTPESEKAPTPRPSPPPAPVDTKSKAKKPARQASTHPSAEGSRRSSQSGGPSRSISPKKRTGSPDDETSTPRSANQVSRITLKFKLSTSDETGTIPEEPADDPPYKSKKRKPVANKGRADDEVRDKAGAKKAKTSHPVGDEIVAENQVVPPPEPVKKGTAVKRKATGRIPDAQLDDLFGDDEAEADDQPEAGPSITAVNPVAGGEPNTPVNAATSKAKKGSKVKRSMIDPPLAARQEALAPEAGSSGPLRARRKGSKAEPVESGEALPATEGTQQSVEESQTTGPVTGRKKGKKVADIADSTPSAMEEDVKTDDHKPASTTADEGGKIPPAPAKKSKTFAQAVTGSPAAAPTTETETGTTPGQSQPKKRPISSIPKIAKLSHAASPSPLSTPQASDKKPPVPGPSGSTKKATPAPSKKVVQAPSLLESTLATLHAANAGASTPKKEVSSCHFSGLMTLGA